MTGRPLRPDYDADPTRFAANRTATASYSTIGDVHAPVARRLSGLGITAVLDLGGGTGTLARALGAVGIGSVVVDAAAHVHQAPRPAVRADLAALPFRDRSWDAAAALWVLYHLDDPRDALREAARVLRPGAWFVACASARDNDPEFAGVLPGWGGRTTFDAEEAGDVVGSVMSDVAVERWDAPAIELPDQAAVALFLRGRGLTASDAEHRAGEFPTPMRVTKRGCLVWAKAPG